MKKILITILGLTVLFLVACENDNNKPPAFDPDENLDLENIFFDDFSNGIDRNVWSLGNRQWGGEGTNNGVVPENVYYTSDGIVVLQANGDYYAGPDIGFGGKSGQRTGATLISNQTFGPGRFEVKMKAMPRFGASSAIWTFYYESPEVNHEIDIELNTQDDFYRYWATNWISETIFTSYKTTTPVLNNDGEWHVYRFDWHTDPQRIDYYIDDYLVHTATTYIPTFAGNLWIGAWFPKGWAGTPDFETDYMLIDWVRHTPYLNNPYFETPPQTGNPANHYPQSPIELPVANLISNASFDGIEAAWKKNPNTTVIHMDGEGINGKTALYVPKDEIAYQIVSGMHESFELTLEVYAKLNSINDKGQVYIEYRPLATELIGDAYVIDFSSEDDGFVVGEYYKKIVKLQLPVGTRRVEISLIGTEGDGVYFGNLNMTKEYIE